MTSLTADLIHAFIQTDYLIVHNHQKMILRIGEYSVPLKNLHTNLGHSNSAIITAFNPRSTIYPIDENMRRQRELESDLKAQGLILIPATGKDPQMQWPGEPGFLAVGISQDDAFRLGRKYQQNAIVYADPEAVPTLVLLR